MAAHQQPQTTRAIFRSAEDLYSQLPVRDVVRVLAKTKEDAEKKREELRELVGQRYHDLIDSADAIISMNDTVVGFEKMLLTIEASANTLLTEQANTHTKPLKRKQQDLQKEIVKPNRQEPSEQDDIDRLLMAPTEIWTALEQGNERKAARVYMSAIELAARLRINGDSKSNGSLSAEITNDLLSACKDLALQPESTNVCVTLATKAQYEKEMCGEWFLKFPFLLSQLKLLQKCRADIINSVSTAFSDRQISTSRVERAVEALLLIKETSNPLKSLLETRTLAVKSLSSNDEESLFAIAELTARTIKDCDWMKTRFDHLRDSDIEISRWIEGQVAPQARLIAETVCARTQTIASLASLQKSLNTTIRKIDVHVDSSGHEVPSTSQTLNDPKVFEKLFAQTFTARGNHLIQAAQDALLRKVKRLLQASGNSLDDKRNQYAHRAFALLDGGLAQIDKDIIELRDPEAKATGTPNYDWLNSLVLWLQPRPTPCVSRFCDLLLSYLKDKKSAIPPDVVPKLEEIQQRSLGMMAEIMIKRSGEELEVALSSLPWGKEGRSTCAQMGGWTVDSTLAGSPADLPSVPSWPVASMVFALSRDLDQATDAMRRGSTACEESDVKLRKMVAEGAFKRLYTLYSAFAKEAAGPDGKLQAAFDLEFVSSALLDSPRPVNFTVGGVDVYAFRESIQARAKAFANSSRLLHSSIKVESSSASAPTASPVVETKVGAHALLTVVEPVSRFALLPVAQKRSATPGKLLHRTSSQNDDSFDKMTTSLSASNKQASAKTGGESTSRSIGGVNLGRVLGWLT